MTTPKFSVIITGTTGMVGEGVLHECLKHPDVKEILIVNRKSLGLVHPKLKEIIHADFFDLSPIANELKGYDACFFCLGTSVIGKKEEEYFRVTYTLTMEMANLLGSQSPDSTFCYISGASTDSSEKGRSMWARIKGKTENDLMKLNFKKVFAFRPGFIKPTKGLKNIHSFYKFITWLFPIGRALYAKGFCTMKELGLAMIRSTGLPDSRRIFEGDDIIILGKKD